MEDVCIACFENLATIQLSCGHRTYCTPCYERIRENRNFRCPLRCQVDVGLSRDALALQLRETTTADIDVLDPEIYPYGARLFGTNVPASRDIVRAVREALRAVDRGHLSVVELQRALGEKLTLQQYQVAMVELFNDTDLHRVLQLVDKRTTETMRVTKRVQQLITYSIESMDMTAIFTRAAMTTAASVGVALATGGIGAVSAGVSGAAAGGVGLIVLSVFSVIEIYRWSKGDIDGKTCLVNIGEHAVGVAAGVGGAMLGAMAGSAIFPVIGTVVGGMVGGLLGSILLDGAGRLLYRRAFDRYRTIEVQEEIPLTPEEIARNAARVLDIDLQRDSFDVAQVKYRGILLRTHPDRALSNLTAEELDQRNERVRNILSAWAVVRKYYEDGGRIDEISTVQEAFINVWVLKMKEAVSEQWRIVRSWLGDMPLGRDLHDNERLESVVIYV